MNYFIKFLSLLSIVTVGFSIATQTYAAPKYNAHMTGAVVTAVNSTSLNVTYKSTNYTIDTTGTTKVVRRFGAKSALDQISNGDKINVLGNWTDSNKTTVDAVLIRDGSIQEKNDTFSGTVNSLTSNGFVLNSMHRGQQTVTISSGTKIKNKKGQTLAQNQIAVNDKIRVDGMWDRTLKTIAATNIRDMSR